MEGMRILITSKEILRCVDYYLLRSGGEMGVALLVSFQGRLINSIHERAQRVLFKDIAVRYTLEFDIWQNRRLFLNQMISFFIEGSRFYSMLRL